MLDAFDDLRLRELVLFDRVVALGQRGFQYWYYNIPLFDMVEQGHHLGERAQALYTLLQSTDFIDRNAHSTCDKSLYAATVCSAESVSFGRLVRTTYNPSNAASSAIFSSSRR